MNRSRAGILVAAIVSLALHLALAAIFVPAETEVQIAGGTPVDLMIVGTAFADALAAGEISDNAEEETLKPVDNTAPHLEPVDDVKPHLEPVEAATLEASDPEELQSVVAELVESVNADNLGSATPPTFEPVEVENVTAEAAPPRELSAVAEVPLPRPRPKMTEAERARIETPVKQKTRKAKVSKPAAKVQPKQNKAVAKPKAAKSSAGNGGKQATSSSRGASKGAKTTKKQTRAGNAAVSNYPGKVASKLRRALRYPRAAQKDRLKGQAVVSFTVAANGSVSSVRIARSSGSPLLDKAALEAVHRAAPFSPIPSAAGRRSWSFTVPLAFKP